MFKTHGKKLFIASIVMIAVVVGVVLTKSLSTMNKTNTTMNKSQSSNIKKVSADSKKAIEKKSDLLSDKQNSNDLSEYKDNDTNKQENLNSKSEKSSNNNTNDNEKVESFTSNDENNNTNTEYQESTTPNIEENTSTFYYDRTTSIYANDNITLLRVEYYVNNKLAYYSVVEQFDTSTKSYIEKIYKCNRETNIDSLIRTDEYFNGNIIKSY